MLHRAVYAIVVIAAIAAALVLALRFVLLQVSNYEAEIVTRLSEMVGGEVRIGNMQARLSGIEPVVELSGVHVVAPSGEALRAERAQIEFNLWKSLLHRRVTISDLRVGGIDLLVVTDADGNSSVSGVPLPLLGAGEGVRRGSARALPNLSVHFEQANVRWRNEQTATDYEFENASAAFESADGRLKFAIKTSPPPVFGRVLHVAADLRDVGDVNRRWHGRVYARADEADLAAWSRLIGKADAVRGVFSAELWSDWQDGDLRRLDGAISCEDCVAENIGVVSGQTRLSWEAQTEGWRLGLLEAALTETAGRLALEHSDIALVYHGDHSRLVLRTPSLDPKLLRALSAMKEGVEVSATQGTAALSATVAHPDLNLPQEKPRKASSWRNHLESRLRFGAEYAAEYADHLLEHSAIEAARLELELQGGALEFPAYSQRALKFSELAVLLRYFKRGAAHNLYVDQLSALVADARVSGSAAWLGGATPQAEAAFEIERLPLAEIERWLPDKGLNPRFKAWLEQAFVAGVLKTGRFEFSGAPSSFPFRKGGGRLHFEGEIAGGELNYRANHKPLRELNAHIVFDNQSFVAEASNLRYYDFRSQAARVVMRNVALPFIELEASGSGSLASVFSYLKDTRLINPDSAVIGALEASGDSRLELSVKTPLSKRLQKPVTVEGALSLDGASLRAASDLAFSDITGVLHFDRRGGRAESLTAKFNGVAVKGGAKPAGEQMPGATVLTLSGAPAISQLPGLSNTPLRDLVEGTASWQTDLLIPRPGRDADYKLQLTLASSLEGVTVKLPAPFGKSAAQRRDLSAKLAWGGQNEYALSYGKAIKAKLVKDTRASAAGDQPSGYLHFGDTAPPAVERGVFKIGGEVSEAVEMDDWLRLGGGDADFSPYFSHVDLSLAELRKGGEPLGGASLIVKPRSGGRELRIAAPWAQGWVFLPDADDGTVFAKMERLFLPESTPTAVTSLKPATLPAFELEVADFKRGDMNVSGLHLVTEPMDGGMKIGRLAFEAGEVLVVISGRWLFDGRQHRSRVDLDVNGRDYGKTLELLDFKSSLNGGDGSLIGRVSWLGPPTGFSMEKLEGDIRLDLKNGVVEKADPGVGRLLGLFSVNHIVRRLTLDFSDLIEKGLAFETMEGNLNFHNGVMHTEDFVIVGPSVSMAVSGDNFIAEKRYDQQIDVVPNLSSGLPVAGALLGGPITGAAVLLVDKLTRLGSKMDKIVTLRYHLHGGWDDPQVDFQGAPETAKGPGKIKKLLEKMLP